LDVIIRFRPPKTGSEHGQMNTLRVHEVMRANIDGYRTKWPAIKSSASHDTAFSGVKFAEREDLSYFGLILNACTGVGSLQW